MKKKLFVIDGHALCYRAYYALIRSPLFHSDGQNTSAIFGFARMILKLIQDQKPDYLIVAFDPGGKTFRSDIYPEYKANRKKMPEELQIQIEEIKNMVKTMGVESTILPGFEADDLLGSISKKFASPDLEVTIVTGDKDAYQLLSENIKIYSPKKGISEYVIYTAKDIEEKLGFKIDQIIDYMALMGDTADNIPGGKGIGEKTAQKLIVEYHDLENLYENIDDVKGRQQRLLVDDKENIMLSRELVIIKNDLEIDYPLEKLSIGDIKTDELKDYFVKLEMQSIIDDFFDGMQDQSDLSTDKKNYKTINTISELRKAISVIEKKGEVSIDTETTSKHAIVAELIGISLSIEEHSGWYLPLHTGGLFNEDIIDRDLALQLIKPMIENPKIKKIGQNIKYDFNVLRNEGIELKNIFFDTMIASYLINPGDRRHNLDELALKYLNYKTIKYSELVGKGKNAIPISDIPINDLANYAIEDADITFRLYKIFKEKLNTEKLLDLFYDVEMKLVHVLADMEYLGVKIDATHFDELNKENDLVLKDCIERIYYEAEEVFNINSTKELARILFEKLGLKTKKKTKTGYSTDIKVLESLIGSHKIIEHLIFYRTRNKLKSTYIEALPKLIVRKTGRIHSSYNQTVVATGRLSSSEPNLQNIPIRDEFGKHIRKGFIPEKGFTIMAADYSQIELRLAAHLSGDSNMIKAFIDGIDIHTLTASNVYNLPMEKIQTYMRRQAKIINFATIYGVSPYGLAQQSDIGIKEASKFIEIYFETYPGFKEYMKKTVEYARDKGYVKTLLGRKRLIPEIKSDAVFRREGAERMAINTPIQGTSADMIKIAMINIAHKIEKEKLNSRMIMQVHDELVFEVDLKEKDEFETMVKEKMEKVFDLSVPIIIDIGWGDNWEEAH